MTGRERYLLDLARRTDSRGFTREDIMYRREGGHPTTAFLKALEDLVAKGLLAMERRTHEVLSVETAMRPEGWATRTVNHYDLTASGRRKLKR